MGVLTTQLQLLRKESNGPEQTPPLPPWADVRTITLERAVYCTLPINECKHWQIGARAQHLEKGVDTHRGRDWNNWAGLIQGTL